MVSLKIASACAALAWFAATAPAVAVPGLGDVGDDAVGASRAPETSEAAPPAASWSDEVSGRVAPYGAAEHAVDLTTRPRREVSLESDGVEELRVVGVDEFGGRHPFVARGAGKLVAARLPLWVTTLSVVIENRGAESVEFRIR